MTAGALEQRGTPAQADRRHAPDQSQISRVPYLPGLDGLRALAVVAVMVYHADSTWLPGGFLGVEVFFVISGYLITLLLIAECERTGRVDLGRFWLRRAKRLLPALFVMLFIVVVYTAVFRSDALGQIRGDVVASVFYLTNWYQIWVGQGYSAAGDFAPLRHLWSLAVEEQFYLLWPLVMAAMLRVGPRRIAAAARWLVVAAVVVTVAVAVLYHPGRIVDCETTPAAFATLADRCISKADALYLSTVTRSGGLLLGAAFAMLWRPVAVMRGRLRSKGPAIDLLAGAGLVVLAAMTWSVHFVTPSGAGAMLFRGGFLMTGILTILVIAAVTHQAARSGALLGNPVFLWVGTRSYGLYLYHWPIYQMIRQVAGNPLTLTEFAGAMVATAAITEASFRWIETPIRTGHALVWWRALRESRDPLPRRIMLTAGASCAALVLFSTVSLVTAPLEPTDLERSLAAGEEATTDLDDLVGGDVISGESPSSIDTPDTTASSLGPTPSSVVAAAATPPSSTTSTAPPVTTTLPPEPVAYLAIGDSVMLGAAPELVKAGIVVDAAESRQLSDVISTMQKLRDQDVFGIAVIVHLGTNGTVTQAELDQLMDTLVSVPNVLVLTVRANRDWIASNNERLRALGPGGTNARGNVILIDWEQRASECVDDCFARDGFHLNPNGRQFYTSLILETLGISPG